MTEPEFYARVFHTNRCHLWTGALNGRGYGNLRIKGKVMYAHRLAYELYIGPIPEGLDLMHECDNPVCVNPEHLIPCTHAENMADMAKKGRKPGIKGSANHNAKLTTEQAKAILADPRFHRVIAAEYGVSQAAVAHIKVGRNWKHLHG